MRRLARLGTLAVLVTAMVPAVAIAPAHATTTQIIRMFGFSGQHGLYQLGGYLVDDAPMMIQASVKTPAGDVLPGVAVTFTVDLGYVNPAGAETANPTQRTVTSVTDENGRAAIGFGSEQSGSGPYATQHMSVQTSAASTKAVATFYPAEGASLTVTPDGVAVRRGTTRDYVAQLRDRFGNPTPDYLCFDLRGPGTFVTSDEGIDQRGVATYGRIMGTLTEPIDGSARTGTVEAVSNCGDEVLQVGKATYTVPDEPAVSAVSAYAAKGAAVGSTKDFVSSKVTNSAGQPVTGAEVSFAISGSTVQSGTAISDSTGTAKLPFVPQHAGPLSVTASYPGAFPATTAGSTAKAAPTTTLTQVSPQRYRIRDTATITVKQAGIQVDFYQRLASGRNVYVGSGTTDSSGVAVLTRYGLKSGYHYTGIAKVSGANPDYNGPNSVAVTTTVR